jgi:hypothetical protein
MIGTRVTIVRERPDLHRTFTTHGEVIGVNRDEHAAVTGVLVRGTRDGGSAVHGWYAVGPHALDGSLVTSQTATVDACGHDVATCPCHPVQHVHVTSATLVDTEDGRHVLAMCGTDLGPYAEASTTHPVGNYLRVDSPTWHRITCQPCRNRFKKG